MRASTRCPFWIEDYGHLFEIRIDFLEQFDPLAADTGLAEKKARDISSGAIQAFNEALSDGVGNGPKYYWDDPCFTLERRRNRSAVCKDYIGLQGNRFFCKQLLPLNV